MKKFLVVCAASLLLCLHGTAQEYAPVPGADNSGRGVGLSIIPRFDFNYNGEFTLGDSSLYSLIEGDISDVFSISICNHWLAADVESIGALYNNTFRSDDVNWLDWAYLTANLGNISFSLGKQVLSFGGFEFDAYDFESHSFINSSVWNNLQVYQWGAKIGWTDDEENSTLSAQVTTSPFGEHPFTSKLFNYGFEWRGEFEDFHSIWSVVAMQRDVKDFIPLVSLGTQYDLSDSFTAGLDVFSAVGDENNMVMNGLTMIPSIAFHPGESFEIKARVGGEMNSKTRNKDFIAGIDGFWFPVPDNDQLRLHFAAGYRHDENLLAFTLGALYYLNIPRR
ncbi:MAG: hypothetical protein IKX45_01130 [Bacteroidales bacterium]|nr:hypothetical protein [Bacteroidales bacterium]